MKERRGRKVPEARRPLTDLVGTYVLSYLLAAVLLGSLVYSAGVWNVLANSRILDLLINSGFVRYHDLDLGFVDGLPDHGLYLLTQDPVDWRLAGFVVVLYLLFWGLRGLHFHRIGRVLGMKGSLAEDSRSHLFGSGLDILAPFRPGAAAVADSCRARGEPRGLAPATLYAQDALILGGIGAFALLGLVLNGWSQWLRELFWGFIILLGAYLVMRSTAGDDGVLIPGRANADDREAIRARLSGSPLALSGIAALTLLFLGIHHVAPYVLSQAFTTDYVILNVSISVIQTGVVAGYIAALVPLTPGGVGQFEWGFAAALYMAGIGLPEAATIALLESVVRNGTGLVAFGAASLWKGASASGSEVLDAVLRTPATGRVE